jgi:flagellar biosynthesis protein FliP
VRRAVRAAVILATFILFASVPLVAAQSVTPSPDLKLAVEGIGSVSAPLQIVMVLTLLSFLPAALVIMTSFTRIVIVFHFLRQETYDLIRAENEGAVRHPDDLHKMMERLRRQPKNLAI